MTDSVVKPSHREWRRAVKKARRKRIRQQLAEERKRKEREREKSPSYQLQLEKERLLEEYELEREAKESQERHRRWLEEEERAQKVWREEQRLRELAEEERAKELERIREEWEREQKRIREEKERKEAAKKEEERRRQETVDRINDFIENGGALPPELQTVCESNPGKELCAFFHKVGACRFGHQCSRNHQHYKLSNVLMIMNFYAHFTLDQSKSSEYDTDINLEYEDSDMYLHFRDFYLDIVPEFKKFGEVSMVKVCCNSEPHLRGNVYVEYQNERDALVAYRNFQGRWYGGKQLNIEFVKIKDWGGAVCGDFSRKRCPKGKSCNFLHVFRNPRNEFAIDWNRRTNVQSATRDSFDDSSELSSRRRDWRWSESPERPSKQSRRQSENSERSGKKSKRRSESPERFGKQSRRRSQSPERAGKQSRRSESPERSRKQSRRSDSPERSGKQSRRSSKSPERSTKDSRRRSDSRSSRHRKERSRSRSREKHRKHSDRDRESKRDKVNRKKHKSKHDDGDDTD